MSDELLWNYNDPLSRVYRESLRSNRAFRDYWNMGEGRSLRRLLEKYRENTDKDPTDKQPSTKWNTICAWSKHFEWQARIARLTELRNEKEEFEQEREWREYRKELREKERELSRQLIKKAEDMLKFPLARVSGEENGNVTVINPAGWRLRDAARLLDTASKIGRLSAEMETERSDITSGGKPLERMSDEELLRYIQTAISESGIGNTGSETTRITNTD